MIPLMGTTLGSLMVFLMRDKVRAQTEKLLLGFASGVMIAASVWSLLIPSMELSERGYGKMNWVPAVVGFAAEHRPRHSRTIAYHGYPPFCSWR